MSFWARFTLQQYGYGLSNFQTHPNDNQVLTQQLLWLFRQNWDGQAVRNIGVYSSKLSANSCQQLNLFETPHNQMRRSRLNQVIDEIHRQFGFTKLVD